MSPASDAINKPWFRLLEEGLGRVEGKDWKSKSWSWRKSPRKEEKKGGRETRPLQVEEAGRLVRTQKLGKVESAVGTRVTLLSACLVPLISRASHFALLLRWGREDKQPVSTVEKDGK